MTKNVKFKIFCIMKKIIFVVCLMATMIACTGNSTKTAEPKDSTAVDTTVVNSHTLIDTVHID